MIRKHLLAMGVLFSSTICFSQQTQTDSTNTEEKLWQKGMSGNINFSQVSFSNWASGGDNSISLNAFTHFFANYEKEKTSWSNTLELGYGLMKQGSKGFEKTDDKINFITEYNRQISKKKKCLFFHTLIDFRTQFADGFSSEEEERSISGFMAPGYLVFAVGLNYKPAKFFNLNFSPATGKSTFVLNQKLANAGAFGVKKALVDDNGNILEEGEKYRLEIGSFLKANFNKEIFKNVTLKSRVELFTNYLKNFGNIDVNWDNTVLMKINSVLSASLIMQLIYDDDITIAELNDQGDIISEAPKIQLKQIFGLGISYSFGEKIK